MAETHHTSITGKIIATTDRAVLLEEPSGDETWIPRSVIDGGDDIEEQDVDPNVADWFIEKEGL